MAASSSNVFYVMLYRDSLHTPWGFRLDGGTDFMKPLRVQRVVPTGAAEGQIQPGDEILAIGQTDASSLSHEEATELIGTAGGVLNLQIARGVRYDPPSIRRASQPSNKTANSIPNHTISPKPQMELRTKGALNEEESVIPRNSKLAKLMNQSLKSGDTQTMNNGPKKSHQGYRSLPWVRRHSSESEDITAFLPRVNRSTHQPQSPIGHSVGPRETQIRSQVRDSMLRSPSQGSQGSGRSTPSSVLELGSPGDAKSPPAIGVWIPPTHHPNSKLVHLQYNSPLNMYTPHNVADMVQKQTGQKLSWNRKPTVRFLEDIRDSPTYKLVQEIEQPDSDPARSRRALSYDHQFEQSQTIKNLNRHFYGDGFF